MPALHRRVNLMCLWADPSEGASDNAHYLIELCVKKISLNKLLSVASSQYQDFLIVKKQTESTNARVTDVCR